MSEVATPHRAASEAGDHFGLDAAFVDGVAEALRSDDKERIRKRVGGLHHADMADLIEHLDDDDRRLLIEAVREDFNPEVLPELAPQVRDTVMDALGFEDFAAALSELDSDDAIHIASKLTEDERAAIAKRMPQATRMLIEQGLAHPVDSAGRLMQRELVAVPNYWTVGETIDYMRAAQNLPDRFYVIFVVDARHRPRGMVELSRLLRSKRPEKMQDLIEKDVEPVPVEMDREDVAFRFKQRDLVTAPVIDKSGRLVGQITIDDVVDIIEQEAAEDILKLAGVGNTQVSSLYNAIIQTSTSRFYWLFINLLTAFLASWVVGLYEDSIAKLAALAVLMPIVAGMGGNSGTQTLATAIRAIATRELDSSNAVRICFKELFVGMINGLLFAAIVGVAAGWWFTDAMLGIVIGVAMFINMTVAGLSGIVIPLLIRKFGSDPADSGGVILTTVTDVVGFFTFLGLATWLLL
ncbi:MAG: magnesium transporter [Alphaproteobacteria bacterium]|nr:magnesium transporter [Alphaproteobacteria bacterium]